MLVVVAIAIALLMVMVAMVKSRRIQGPIVMQKIPLEILPQAQVLQLQVV